MKRILFSLLTLAAIGFGPPPAPAAHTPRVSRTCVPDPVLTTLWFSRAARMLASVNLILVSEALPNRRPQRCQP